ncbi:membrane integrity-associated transporter subunit PqiC [Candidatus Sumerlaeota bacterium]|nr:membrane integrity-associated transporter subunit PqiC [Candidatus Sumerlaeota bacterium]
MKIPRTLIEALTFLIFLTGCLHRNPPVPIHFYTLQERKPAEEKPVKKSAPSLGILPFQSASSVETRILYRTSPVALGYYEYERWAESPGEMMTRAFSEFMDASGLFSSVSSGRNYSPASVKWILTGVVERFEEDRSSSPPSASLTVALEIYQTNGNIPIWNKRLTAREPLERDTREHLAVAMDKNLTRILEETLTAVSKIQPAEKD